MYWTPLPVILSSRLLQVPNLGLFLARFAAGGGGRSSVEGTAAEDEVTGGSTMGTVVGGLTSVTISGIGRVVGAIGAVLAAGAEGAEAFNWL